MVYIYMYTVSALKTFLLFTVYYIILYYPRVPSTIILLRIFGSFPTSMLDHVLIANIDIPIENTSVLRSWSLNVYRATASLRGDKHVLYNITFTFMHIMYNSTYYYIRIFYVQYSYYVRVLLLLFYAIRRKR